MEDYFESFRLNLKYYQEKNEISQSQLAIGADCTNGLIGQIEAGLQTHLLTTFAESPPHRLRYSPRRPFSSQCIKHGKTHKINSKTRTCSAY